MKIGGIQKLSTVDFPGHIAASVFTLGCNMRCGYCHNPELVLPEQFLEPIPEEDILAFLKTRQGLLDAVVISGGEPTIHDDLPKFIRAIRNLGFKVKLDTNGTRPEMLKELIDAKQVDFIAMDVKGPYDKYTNIAARPIDEAAIKESINQILRIDHEFRTTITTRDLDVEDMHAIGKMVRGAKRFALQKFVPGTTVSRAYRNAKTFTESEMKEAQNIMKQYVTECVVH